MTFKHRKALTIIAAVLFVLFLGFTALAGEGTGTITHVVLEIQGDMVIFTIGAYGSALAAGPGDATYDYMASGGVPVVRAVRSGDKFIGIGAYGTAFAQEGNTAGAIAEAPAQDQETISGYLVFEGFDGAGDPILTPLFSDFTVTFDGNGGVPPLQTEQVEPGQKVDPLPTVTREGHTFLEWNSEPDGTGFEFSTATAVTADITVYAIWEAEIYTVTFDGNSGEPAQQVVTVDHGTTINPLPTASKANHGLVQWNSEPDGTGDPFTTATEVKADMTVYAIWSEVQVVFTENFTGIANGNIPTGWQRTNIYWGVSSTSGAGGTAPEVRFLCRDALILFDVRLNTPDINASAAQGLTLSFKHYAQRWQLATALYTLKVQVSTNGGASWSDLWSATPAGDIGPETLTLDLSDYDGQTIRIGWNFYLGWGNELNAWRIDDIVLTGY